MLQPELLGWLLVLLGWASSTITLASHRALSNELKDFNGASKEEEEEEECINC